MALLGLVSRVEEKLVSVCPISGFSQHPFPHGQSIKIESKILHAQSKLFQPSCYSGRKKRREWIIAEHKFMCVQIGILLVTLLSLFTLRMQQ